MIYMYFLLYLQEEFVEQSRASISWFIIMTLMFDLGVIFKEKLYASHFKSSTG